MCHGLAKRSCPDAYLRVIRRHEEKSQRCSRISDGSWAAFLDEPAAGLNPIGAAKFNRLTKELKEALGRNVFLIIRDLYTLHAICNRVTVLADHHENAIGKSII